MKTAELISPYGGELVNLLVDRAEKPALKEYAEQLHSIQLSTRATCDLELLAVGAFSPLDHFMGKRDYQCVLNESRLSNGYIFPIPVTLSVEPKPEIRLGQDVALRDSKNNLLAVMSIREIYEWDWEHEARRVFGRVDLSHPVIAEIQRLGRINISGPLRVLQLPPHYDFRGLHLTPAETRARLRSMGHENVVAFQTRKSLQRVHQDLTERTVQEINGSLLLHPVVGMTNNSDIDHYARVRAYRAFTEDHDDPSRVTLALLPLAMRMAGPREAVWHMVIRRNYGANYMIVGRDHAGPGNDSTGKPFYDPNDAQEVAELYSAELGMHIVSFK
jgi:sulfate adenylyltransferase